MAQERRQHRRIQGPFDGTFEGAAGRRQARIVDLSVGGCFVDVLSGPAKGDPVKLELQVGDRKARLRGEVVYVDKVQGFAVRFTENPPAETEQLLAILDSLG